MPGDTCVSALCLHGANGGLFLSGLPAIGAETLVSSRSFYLVTNFGAWAGSGLFAKPGACPGTKVVAGEGGVKILTPPVALAE